MFDFAKRQKHLMKEMKENSIDSLILSDRKDIYYHTGFMALDGDFAFLIFRQSSKPALFVHSVSNRAENLKTANPKFVKDVYGMIKQTKFTGTLGFDEKSLTVSSFMEISKNLKGHRLKKPCSEMIKSQRTVKDEDEIREMKKASKMTEKIISQVRNYMKGKKETEVANRIRMNILKNGAGDSFESIVASGKNSAFIHYIPGKRIITPTDLVIIDMGIVSNNYCSDMTRTFCFKSGQKGRTLHENILEIQNILIDNIHDGVKVDDLNKIYEKEMKKKKYQIQHGWGHSIGLDVHDPGFKEFKKGMVVTVEPGAYIKGFGGCRIEDMVLVGKNKSEKITKSESSL